MLARVWHLSVRTRPEGLSVGAISTRAGQLVRGHSDSVIFGD